MRNAEPNHILAMLSRLSSNTSFSAGSAMADPAFKNPFQAVSIVSGIKNCQAVRDLTDKRFLASEAPLLPLDGCTSTLDCTCRYAKWDDRRQEDRRMIDNGIGAHYYADTEKRKQRKGRRSTD